MRRSLPSAGVANTLSFVRDAILTSSGYGGGHMQSWKDVLRLTHSLGLTLLGAGTIGALLLLRQLSPSSAFSWILQARVPHSSSDDPSSVDPCQLTIPGLRNAGNNCFLNAVLQALASSGIVLSFLAAYDRESILSLFNGVESRCISLPLTEALSDLLGELSELYPQPRVASPRHVMHALEPYAKQFDLSLQQDAAEALNYLADALQEERLAFFDSFRAFRESISDASRTLNEMVIEDANEKENGPLSSWKRWPLEGTMGSMLICQECGFQFSTQFHSFLEVPLSPPHLPDGKIVTGCNLEACLEQFTAPECIPNVSCSYCSHSLALRHLQRVDGLDKAVLQRIKDCTFDDDCSCEQLVTQMGGVWRNVYVKALKQLRIGRCPEVMCCQVQRVVVSSSGELVKWTGHVSFPLVLNVHPYVMTSQGHIGKQSGQLKGPNEVLHKFLWPKRISEMQSNFEFSNVKVPSSSTDGSSSDDTHLSGSEDLASDTSSESMAGRSGDEFAEKHKEVGDITSWDSCNDSIGFRDLKMCGLDSGLFSKLGQAHTSLDGKDQLLLRFRELGDCSPFIESHPQAVPMHNLLIGTPIPMTAMATSIGQSKDRELHEMQRDSACSSKRWLYELISVVVHHGSSKGGHYTVYRKVKFKEIDFIEEEHPSGNLDDGVTNLKDSNVAAMDVDDCVSEASDEATTNTNVSIDLYAERLSKDTSNSLEWEGLSKVGDDSSSGVSSSYSAQIREEFLAGQMYVNSKPPLVQTSGSDKESEVKGDAHIQTVENPKLKQPPKEETVLWFRVSDCNVTLVTEEEVLMAQATLLFYERSLVTD